MIVGKMLGGLGNQMFCYAFARSLQLKYGGTLYLDCQVYNRYKIRDFSLDKLSIPSTVKKINEAKMSKFSLIYFRITQKLYHVFYKLKKVITRTDIIGDNIFSFLGKRGLYYNFDRYYYPTRLTKKEKKCSYGYFQSEKYFLDYKEQIRNELKVSIEPTAEEAKLISNIKSNNSVGISIRWGADYRKSHLNICDRNYYYRAMDLIAGKVKEPVFYIFSDCVDEVKTDFDFKYPVQFVQGFRDYESLRLLYSCKYFIISNSSFSWWGAYLSDFEDKVVISPSRWYLDSTKKPDIYLDDMILLDVE